MAKRGKKVTAAKKARVLELSKSHGAKAVASALGISVSEVYKIKREPRHFRELSITALTLASNLESYLDNLGTVFGKIGNMVYGGGVHDIGSGRDFTMERLDKSVALNLLYHLREEFPELLDLNEWADLTGDRITPDLIERLRLKAYRGDFKGKCKDCPS